MSEDPEILEQGGRGSVPLFPKSVGKLKPDAQPPQRLRYMTRDMAVDQKPVSSTPTFEVYKSVSIHHSNKYVARDGRDEELRLAQVDIKNRLNKLDSGLRMLKAKLRMKEEQLISRCGMSKGVITAEQELKVKIEKAKAELSAREKQATARRTKKNDLRDERAKKQTPVYEQQEAKRREQAKTDSDVEMASARAAMSAFCEDDFDIDIYGD